MSTGSSRHWRRLTQASRHCWRCGSGPTTRRSSTVSIGARERGGRGRVPCSRPRGHDGGRAYPLHLASSEPGAGDRQAARLRTPVRRAPRRLLAELTSDVQPGQSRRLLLSIGSQQSLVLDQLEQLGLRGRVDVVAYMPTDWAPLAPPTGNLLRRVDVVVPYTAFAGRALHVICAGQETPRVASPIPHGVDTSVFTPPTGGCARGHAAPVLRAR